MYHKFIKEKENKKNIVSTKEKVKTFNPIVVGEKFNDDFSVLAKGRKGLFNVSGILPEEKAEITLGKVKDGVINSNVVKLISKHKDRVEVNCPYYASCGNCNLLHVSYERQLKEKTALIARKLSNFKRVKIEDCIGFESAERNKVHLVFTQEKKHIKLGFFNEITHDVISVESCLMHGEWLNVVIKKVSDWANANKLQAYNPKTKNGLLRFLVVRKLEDNILITIVSTKNKVVGLEKLYDDLKENFNEVGIYLNVNNNRTNEVFSNKFIYVLGSKKLKGSLLGVNFELSPGSFYQVNQLIAENIYSEVVKFFKNADVNTVVDAYSGIGITSLLFAKYVKKVISIEIEEKAVEDAKQLAQNNRLGHKIKHICGDCNEILPKLKIEGKFAFFVDPPRRGLGNKVCRSILKFAPKNIVYLSCNPDTLAEDLKTLSSSYKIEKIQPYDMFNSTKHVECLVCLTKK